MIFCKVGGTPIFEEPLGFGKQLSSHPDVKVNPKYIESRSYSETQFLVAFGKEVIKKKENFANVSKEYGNIDQSYVPNKIKEIEKEMEVDSKNEFCEALNSITPSEKEEKEEKDLIIKKVNEGFEKNKEDICNYISKNRNKLLNLLGIN